MSGGCGEEEAVPKSGKWGRAIPESGELYLGKTDGAESYLEVEVEILMHLVLKVSVNLKKQEAVVVQGDRFPVFFGSLQVLGKPPGEVVVPLNLGVCDWSDKDTGNLKASSTGKV